MIKIIIITKRIIASIVGWININKLHFTAKLGFQSMQRHQVISFNDQIFSYRSIFIPFNFSNFLFTVWRVAFPVGQRFGIEQAVNFILRQNFIKENFFPLFFFFSLPAF